MNLFYFVQANRAFLEQQAIEREQEREDANEQHNKLSSALAEKEKELERERMSSTQLAADVQHLQEALKEKDQLFQVWHPYFYIKQIISYSIW